eukprot:601720_1
MGNTSNSVAPLTPTPLTPAPQAVDTNKECFNERDEIQIFVQNIDGRILTLSTAKNTSILDCKKSIFVKTGIDIDEQIIYFEGKELINNKNICDYNINSESNINLSLKLKGGCCKSSCFEWTGCCWKWTGCCCERNGCCCCEWTGCCIKCKGFCCCEWNGCCCCKCRDNYKCCCANYKCCCAKRACCLYPEAPVLCCICGIFACITNSTCGFCCGGPNGRCITEKITCMQCTCCGVE